MCACRAVAPSLHMPCAPALCSCLVQLREATAAAASRLDCLPSGSRTCAALSSTVYMYVSPICNVCVSHNTVVVIAYCNVINIDVYCYVVPLDASVESMTSMYACCRSGACCRGGPCTRTPPAARTTRAASLPHPRGHLPGSFHHARPKPDATTCRPHAPPPPGMASGRGRRASPSVTPVTRLCGRTRW